MAREDSMSRDILRVGSKWGLPVVNTRRISITSDASEFMYVSVYDFVYAYAFIALHLPLLSHSLRVGL